MDKATFDSLQTGMKISCVIRLGVLGTVVHDALVVRGEVGVIYLKNNEVSGYGEIVSPYRYSFKVEWGATNSRSPENVTNVKIIYNPMETKEVKITVPEGYEIDRANSTLEHIKFKKLPEKKKNVVTRFEKGGGSSECHINGRWAFVVREKESEMCNEKGCIASGHGATLYLVDSYGTWYDSNGNIISRYLYYKPHNE